MVDGDTGGVGIEAINSFCGVASLGVLELFRARNLDTERFANLMMEKRSVALPFEDPVTNAVNAAKPIVDALSEDERQQISVLMTSSESGIDYSKSIASYVHEYLGLGRNCRFVEVKQACYGATAAIQLAVGYVASGVAPGAKALVIGTDVTLIDETGAYAEPAMGTGGVAILVSDKPRVMKMDLGAFGNYSYEVFDTARPTAELDVGDVDRSLFTYLDCLSNSYQDYARKVDGADFQETFDYLALHTPFAGLVKAGHRKMMREVKRATPEAIEEDFARRVMPSLFYPSMVGNMCSGSVYLALASVIDRVRPQAAVRVGLFSYGSGCASEFFSGVVDSESTTAVAAMGIGRHLDGRSPLSFGEYTQLLAENRRCLVPVRNREIAVEAYNHILARVGGRRPMLALRRVKDFHRKYEWV